MTDLGGVSGPDDPIFGGSSGLPVSPAFPSLPPVRGGGLPLASDRHRCADTPPLILRALEGVPDPNVIDAVRASLRPCPPCVDSLDVEIRFKIAMAQRATDKAPPWLQLRISQTLQRVDLGDIDVTDL